MKDFALAHPFLTVLMLLIIVDGFSSVVKRVLRHMNIRSSGWPPVHLDADGDAVEES